MADCTHGYLSSPPPPATTGGLKRREPLYDLRADGFSAYRGELGSLGLARTRSTHKHTHTVSERLTSDEQAFWRGSAMPTWIRARDEKKQDGGGGTVQRRKVG